MKSAISKILVFGAVLTSVAAISTPAALADHWRHFDRERNMYSTFYDVPRGASIRFHEGRHGFWRGDRWFDAYNHNGRWGMRERIY